MSVSIAQPSCPGFPDGSITVATVSGGPYTYSWLHDGSLAASTATNLLAGIYEVTVQGIDCDTVIDVVLPDPSLPPLGSISVTHLSCAGANDGAATFTLNAPAGSTWTWLHDPTNTSSTITNLPAGTYTVGVVPPPPGCPSFIDGIVGEPGIDILGGPLSYCPNQAPLLTAEPTFGFQPHVYLWSSGSTANSYQVPLGTNGTITITATDTIINCTVNAQVDVVERVPPFAVPVMVDSACQDVAFIVNTVAINADSLEWRWGGYGISNARDPLISFPEPGWQPVSLQAFYFDGCGNLPVQDSVFIVA
ncbi:MAG: SprB repeat-containing protein [Flavobacteriales bacterium]